MPEPEIRNQGGLGLRTQLGKLVEVLEGVVFRKPAPAPPAPIAEAAPAAPVGGERLLRGLGEALERIAAREAGEAAGRTHATR